MTQTLENISESHFSNKHFSQKKIRTIIRNSFIENRIRSDFCFCKVLCERIERVRQF